MEGWGLTRATPPPPLPTNYLQKACWSMRTFGYLSISWIISNLKFWAFPRLYLNKCLARKWDTSKLLLCGDEPQLFMHVDANPLFPLTQAILSDSFMSELLTGHSQKVPLSFLFSSVQFSHSVVSDSPWPHELQHARPPCPSPTPGVHPNPCPSSRWCHPTISSSVVPFCSCPLSFLLDCIKAVTVCWWRFFQRMDRERFVTRGE